MKNFKNVITFEALHKITGINKNLLSHYSTGAKKPRQARKQLIIDAYKHISEELLFILAK